nr:MAG TPA: hypothetical protein [Bacteriophage sp.]
MFSYLFLYFEWSICKRMQYYIIFRNYNIIWRL